MALDTAQLVPLLPMGTALGKPLSGGYGSTATAPSDPVDQKVGNQGAQTLSPNQTSRTVVPPELNANRVAIATNGNLVRLILSSPFFVPLDLDEGMEFVFAQFNKLPTEIRKQLTPATLQALKLKKDVSNLQAFEKDVLNTLNWVRIVHQNLFGNPNIVHNCEIDLTEFKSINDNAQNLEALVVDIFKIIGTIRNDHCGVLSGSKDILIPQLTLFKQFLIKLHSCLNQSV